MRLGITGKLLAIVVPLVVLPCLVTGLLGYIASEEIVTRLLNQAQISLAREIAEKINQDFKTCTADLKLISSLPVLKDYYYNKYYRLFSEAEISRKQVEGFFQDLARKSSLYHRISYLEPNGREVVSVRDGQIVSRSEIRTSLPFIKDIHTFSSERPYISDVLAGGPDGPRVVLLAEPLFDVWNQLSGVVLIELDIDELARRILARRVGREGYAFVVDEAGRTQIHPESKYFGLLHSDLNLPSVEELIGTMLRERQGMVPYYYEGQKIAAFTEVPDRGWVIAVTLPVTEFKAHVMVIKKQVFHIVLVAGSLALAAGIFFSWSFLRPIKKLAQATNVITEGGLPRKIRFESRDELGILTHSFNQMVQNLRRVQAELVKSEKLVSLGRLAAGVAHEIRNPLNTMKVALDLLKRKNSDKQEVMEFAEMISEEITRVDHFLSDFLSYSRQPPPKPAMTDVNEMVEEILSVYSQQAEEKGVVFEKALDSTLPLFPLDPFQMERALINVVINALEAMPQGGRLLVETGLKPLPDGRPNGSSIEISVTNSGPGLTPEELQTVFDPFYTTKELGTGLGLPLTQSIIEGHAGSIHIHSKPAEGTTVTITLPQQLQ